MEKEKYLIKKEFIEKILIDFFSNSYNHDCLLEVAKYNDYSFYIDINSYVYIKYCKTKPEKISLDWIPDNIFEEDKILFGNYLNTDFNLFNNTVKELKENGASDKFIADLYDVLLTIDSTNIKNIMMGL